MGSGRLYLLQTNIKKLYWRPTLSERVSDGGLYIQGEGQSLPDLYGSKGWHRDRACSDSTERGPLEGQIWPAVVQARRREVWSDSREPRDCGIKLAFLLRLCVFGLRLRLADSAQDALETGTLGGHFSRRASWPRQVPRESSFSTEYWG